MAKNRLAVRRSRYTLQAHQHALESIRRDGPRHGAIPRATPHQAFLEALALERIGAWNPAFWNPDILGFGLTWVDPAPDGISLGIPTRFLPDIAAALMPTSSDDELAAPFCGKHSEVGGMPGLRFQPNGSSVILHAPGIAGRIEIPLASPDLWEKAVLIARACFDSTVNLLWDLMPDALHPVERAFTEGWPERYALGGAQYRASRLASDVLRRLPGICKPFSTHDMWFNFRGDEGYHIEFEWQNSGPPRDVLNLLLHRKDGLDVRIDPQDQPIGHFYSDDCTYIRMPGATGGRLDLRHLRDSPQTLKALQHADLKARRWDHTVQRRLELERIYGYPSSEKFLEP
ncbi:hypothetical protein ACLQ2P_07190 [Actinomadura citrea]|uniref:hypothetical protein n=1 Tax=Actinomadura citrea TaxID=46158 RepID=UPI003CE4979D